jgi:hypothetical protein
MPAYASVPGPRTSEGDSSCWSNLPIALEQGSPRSRMATPVAPFSPASGHVHGFRREIRLGLCPQLAPRTQPRESNLDRSASSGPDGAQ